jgi:hypothetical protein
MSAGAPPTDADRRPPMSRTAGLAVLGAVLAAAAIRAPFLADGLWYDETDRRARWAATSRRRTTC